MSLKTIFQQGMAERRRRKSLGKKGKQIKKQEKILNERFTALGKKAWESKSDISSFADAKTALEEAQRNLDELKKHDQGLEQRKQELEEKKRNESERLDTARKGVEEKKRDLDQRLDEQKKILQEAEKKSKTAKDRLAAIGREQTQLENKSAGPESTEAEKAEAGKMPALLQQEAEALQAGIDAREESTKPVKDLAGSLEQGMNGLEKQLDELRKEEKQIISDLDKKIAAVKSELTQNKQKSNEIEKGLQNNQKALGEKLADSGEKFPGLEEELAAVATVRTEMSGVQAAISGLEEQKDEAQVGAYKKMLAIIIGGLVLLAAIVVGLILLLSPKDSSATASGKSAAIKAASKVHQEIAEQIEKRAAGRKAELSQKEAEVSQKEAEEFSKEAAEQLEEMKKQSGQIFADTESTDPSAVASENDLSRALPGMQGWKKQDSEFSSGAAGNIQIATLDTRYISGEDSVRVHITDAGSENSMIISAFKFTLAANIRIDNEERFSRVSSIGGVPVVESVDKETGEARISLAHKDRYLIDLGTSSEKGLVLLREFAAQMDLSSLP
ncbi:MAG TPA: hypothetical protein ENN40_01200 [Candidatus Aminicenantes bacterium]|nr:hypothetical protein [Candidatus Aminicenantes bacterium]